jgi:hypothetical protein
MDPTVIFVKNYIKITVLHDLALNLTWTLLVFFSDQSKTFFGDKKSGFVWF